MFKAVHRATGRTVAIKRMSLERSSEGFPIAALREIKLLSKLQHKNIVQLLDVGTAKYAPPERLLDDTRAPTSTPYSYPWNFFMVCEYAEHSLAGLVNRRYKFSPAQVKSIMKQMLEGLAYLHGQCVVHRDIKSSNILMNAGGEVKLADFGMSAQFVPNRELKGQKGLVTLWYRAPELLIGKNYTESVDMWAVGCVLGELIMGQAVFMGKNELDQLNLISAGMDGYTKLDGEKGPSLFDRLRLDYQ